RTGPRVSRPHIAAAQRDEVSGVDGPEAAFETLEKGRTRAMAGAEQRGGIGLGDDRVGIAHVDPFDRQLLPDTLADGGVVARPAAHGEDLELPAVGETLRRVGNEAVDAGA